MDEHNKLRLQHIELMMVAQLSALSEIMMLFAALTKDGFVGERAEKLQRLSQSCATQREMMPDANAKWASDELRN